MSRGLYFLVTETLPRTWLMNLNCKLFVKKILGYSKREENHPNLRPLMPFSTVIVLLIDSIQFLNGVLILYVYRSFKFNLRFKKNH